MTRNLSFFRTMSLFFLIFILSLIFVKSEYEVTKLPGHKFNTEDEIKAFLNTFFIKLS